MPEDREDPREVEVVSTAPLRTGVPLPRTLTLFPVDPPREEGAGARPAPFSRRRLADVAPPAEPAEATSRRSTPASEGTGTLRRGNAPASTEPGRRGWFRRRTREETPARRVVVAEPIAAAGRTADAPPRPTVVDLVPEPVEPTAASAPTADVQRVGSAEPAAAARQPGVDASGGELARAASARVQEPPAAPAARAPGAAETKPPAGPQEVGRRKLPWLRIFGRPAAAKAPPPAALLAVEDLTVTFATPTGAHPAVDRVSLAIARGEVLGLVGESGAGKSVLGAAMMNLVPQPGRIAAGSVSLEGQRIDTLSERRMRQVRGRRIGLVPQDPLTSLNPLIPVGGQLTETIRAHRRMSSRAALRRAAELLEEVGIPAAKARMRAYPHEFSGGMRQRVAIALALAADPVLVIADEPTTSLDVSVQAQVIAVLKRMCREHGAAVLLVTHDMALVAETADRVAVMYAGRIVEEGPVAEVVRFPRHPYTAGLMQAIPNIDGEPEPLVSIPGAMPRLGTAPPGCPFAPRCPEAWARCFVSRPPMFASGEVAAACFLHEPARAPEPAPLPEPA